MTPRLPQQLLACIASLTMTILMFFIRVDQAAFPTFPSSLSFLLLLLPLQVLLLLLSPGVVAIFVSCGARPSPAARNAILSRKQEPLQQSWLR